MAKSALEKLKQQKSSRPTLTERKAAKAKEAEIAVVETEEEDGEIPTLEEIKAMKTKDLDLINSQLVDDNDNPEPVDGWEELKRKGKQEALIEVFYGEETEEVADSVAQEEVEAVEEEVEDELDAELVSKNPKSKTKEKTKSKTKGKKKKADADSDDLIEKSVAELEQMTEEQADKEVNVIAEDIEYNYFRLGGVLSVIKTNKFIGEYDTFRAKVEAEFGFKYRKADYLINTYNNIVESGVQWDQVKNVGWSKMRVISHLITPENIEEWIERASSMNVRTLEEEVKLMSQEESEDGSGSAKKTTSSVSAMSFKLHDDQKETVNAALEKAIEATGSDVKAVALEAICLDYLSGGKKTKVAPMSIKQFFKKVLKDAEGETKDDKIESAITELLQGEEFEEIFGVPVADIDFSE